MSKWQTQKVGFMAGWRDRKKQGDKNGDKFSYKLKIQIIDIVNLYNGKIS